MSVSSVGQSWDQAAEAKAVCAGCLVRRECLAFALRTRQVHGIWGGLTEEERTGRSRPGSQPSRRPVEGAAPMRVRSG